MYQVHPEYLCVTEWALRDERAQARLRRLAHGFGHPDPPVLTAAELAAVAEERGWFAHGGERTGAVVGGAANPTPPPCPDIVLNAFSFDSAEQHERLRQYPVLHHWLLGGQSAVTLRDSRNHLRGQNAVCQTALELHCAYGCLHACDYCHIGGAFNIMVNLEALADHTRQVVSGNRWCRLWKFDNMTDTITLEPEYGASEVMVHLFAEQRDAFLLLYTKSDNVDHLLGLDHRGQALISWSLAADTASRLIEKHTPPMSDRIEAMRRCQQAGYHVRLRLSPICPVDGWREEATQMLEALFAAVRPEVITMDVLGWMNARQMLRAIDVEMLEPAFRDYVDERAEAAPGPHQKHLFTHEMRREIFRHHLREIRRLSPKTPVSICMETLDMWRDLSAELGMTPGHYACCCGPTSVPGHPLL